MNPLTLYIFPALCLLITGGVIGFFIGRWSVPRQQLPPGAYYVQPYDEPATVDTVGDENWMPEWDGPIRDRQHPGYWWRPVEGVLDGSPRGWVYEEEG